MSVFMSRSGFEQHHIIVAYSCTSFYIKRLLGAFSMVDKGTITIFIKINWIFIIIY